LNSRNATRAHQRTEQRDTDPATRLSHGIQNPGRDAGAAFGDGRKQG
jgi:hypothetical protein